MRMPMDPIHRREGCDPDATTGMHSMAKRPLEERNDATSRGKHNGGGEPFGQCHPIQSRLEKCGERSLLAIVRAMLYQYYREHLWTRASMRCMLEGAVEGSISQEVRVCPSRRSSILVAQVSKAALPPYPTSRLLGRPFVNPPSHQPHPNPSPTRLHRTNPSGHTQQRMQKIGHAFACLSSERGCIISTCGILSRFLFNPPTNFVVWYMTSLSGARIFHGPIKTKQRKSMLARWNHPSP